MINKTTQLFAALGLALCCATTQAASYTYSVPTSVPEGSFYFDNILKRFASNATLLTDGAASSPPAPAWSARWKSWWA